MIFPAKYKFFLFNHLIKTLQIIIFLSPLFLAGCNQLYMQKDNSLNTFLFRLSSTYAEPSLSNKWLVVLANYRGKEKVEMIDLRKRVIVPLPGINRLNSQPISVSVSENGETIALVQQRAGETELIIYRRKSGTSRRLELIPKGVPRRVSIDANGKILAVQVSRAGIWEVDLIRL